MGFLTYYKKYKRLNEAKELTAFDSYDKYTLQAIEEIYDNDLPYDINDYKRQSLKYISNSLNYSYITLFVKEQEKIEEYKRKGSNPVRLASSTSDIKKLIFRYEWCLVNWPEAADAYKQRLYEVILSLYPNAIARHIQAIKQKEQEQAEFEIAVSKASTDKYAPKERDWEKMINYMDKKSDPERLAQSCKDANKIVSRYCIAKALNWEAAAREFKNRALAIVNYATKETFTGLTEPELEAYARKYMNTNIPEQWQDYIDSLRESNTKGGVSQHMENREKNMDTRMQKWLDNCIDVADYETENHSRCCRIIRYDKPDIWIVWWYGSSRQNYYMCIYAYRSAENYKNNKNMIECKIQYAAYAQSKIDKLIETL